MIVLLFLLFVSISLILLAFHCTLIVLVLYIMLLNTFGFLNNLKFVYLSIAFAEVPDGHET